MNIGRTLTVSSTAPLFTATVLVSGFDWPSFSTSFSISNSFAFGGINATLIVETVESV